MTISPTGIQNKHVFLPRLALLLVAVTMLWYVFCISSSEENRNRIILSDGAGYYAYLPAVFIYHDLHYLFCSPDHPQHPDFLAADAGLFVNQAPDGRGVNKYFIGVSVLESPFFFVACVSSSWFGYETDGYSFPFQLAIALAAMFYTLLGLEQIRRLLVKRNIPEYVQAIVILLIFFGTNLFHYAMREPSMSHAYSFAMIALFLNHAHSLFHDPKKYTVLWVGLALAAIIMIRPVNGIVVFSLPLLAGSWKTFLSGIRAALKDRRAVLIGSAAFATLIFFQLLIYKFSSGDWFIDSYSGEELDFTNSHIYNVLFSWRRGWLIYTPLMIFAISGILFLKTNFERIAFFCFLFLVIWVVGSWQQWWYGGAFGMRPLIDYLPAMAIPLAAFVHSACRKWRTLIIAPALTFVVVLNLVQMYQLAMSIMPFDELNAERYARLFFKTNPDYNFIFDPGTLKKHTMPDGMQLVASRIRTFEEDTTGYALSDWGISNQMAYEGKNSAKLGTDQLTAGLSVMLKDVVPDTTKWDKLWVRVKAKVFLFQEEFGPTMAMSIRSDGKEYDWQGCRLIFKVEPRYGWQDFTFDVKIPPPPSNNVELCIFLVHGDYSVAYADNMEMEFWVEP